MNLLNQGIESFKSKLKNGAVIGIFMKSCDPAFIEASGYSGMDYCILDMEHGPVAVENLQNLIRAALVSGVLPIVRVPEVSEEYIGKVLDIGAAGVQIPQILDAVQAERAVSLAKYYPQGQRGVCRYVRAAKYSVMDKFEYFRVANDTLVILQVEGIEGLNNIDEILEVNGIDILFIGPYDLSQSLGVPGDVTNPIVVEKVEYIVDRAKKKNIVIGTFVDNIEAALFWKEKGVQYISYSVDVGIFASACQKVRDEFSSFNYCKHR